MTKKQRFFSIRENEKRCQLAMLMLVKEYADSGKLLCADDFYERCLKDGILPKFIAKYAPVLFRTFKSAGAIRKTKEFKLSTRATNSSSVLPLYECVKR